jgi:dihydroorotate dehydrogenase (NAD+) catalytic subunit
MSAPPDPLLATDLAGIALRTPIILAAGTCGTLDEMADVLDLSRVGGLVTKSITAEPREGNATWRIAPCGTGMLNAIGLANVGAEKFCAQYGPRVVGVPCAVFGSVAGFSIEGYASAAAAMSRVPGLVGLELNVSCPNVHGGVEFGLDAGALRELLSAVKAAAAAGTRIFVKLSPIVAAGPGSTIADIARAAIGSGAAGLCVANTVPAMAIDVRTRRPVLANNTGGYSGPPVHPIAVKLVHDVHRLVAREAGVPIVAIGGVTRWEDAAEFILAGATAVQMGSALFADPGLVYRVTRGLAAWVREQNAADVQALVGAVQRW